MLYQLIGNFVNIWTQSSVMHADVLTALQRPVKDLRQTQVHNIHSNVQTGHREQVNAPDLLCYREKDREIGSLRSELAAARHQISVDERASRVPSSIDTAGMSLQAQSQVERLKAANAKLEVWLGQSGA